MLVGYRPRVGEIVWQAVDTGKRGWQAIDPGKSYGSRM